MIYPFYVDFIKKYYELPQSVILFGSYSNGTDTEKSDIDIAVISSKKEIPDFAKFESKMSRKINLHIIDIMKTPKEFINSLANGVVLEGFVEMIK